MPVSRAMLVTSLFSGIFACWKTVKLGWCKVSSMDGRLIGLSLKVLYLKSFYTFICSLSLGVPFRSLPFYLGCAPSGACELRYVSYLSRKRKIIMVGNYWVF